MRQDIPCWVGGTLRPMDKIDVHRQGLRHPAVSVFIQSGGQILLQQRARTKYHSPEQWANACCTHPHWGEAPVDCAARRLHEELGITGLPLSHRGQIEYRADVGSGMVEHEVVDLFVAKTADRPVLRPDPTEVMATRWISVPALQHEIDTTPGRFTPWLRIYMAQHAARVLPDQAD
ncbi:MAG: isopentenyl-diphosphate delta-isomerase Idi [Rhodobacteraceae bacterium HLUCCA12]|nr:MAG: isopentenyl-diphosphate delta-isomerase Idi [Rhodobacteraceae bacterium HLUCCA12]